MTENGVITKLTCFLQAFQNNFSLLPTNPRKKKTGWNTVKRNVFDFSGNSIGSALHGCCFLGSNCLIPHPIRTMFFNELIQFRVDGLSSWANSNVKTAQLDSGFCFLIGKPATQNRLNLFWNTYLLFHQAKYQTTELSSACEEVVSTNLLNYEDIYV